MDLAVHPLVDGGRVKTAACSTAAHGRGWNRASEEGEDAKEGGNGRGCLPAVSRRKEKAREGLQAGKQVVPASACRARSGLLVPGEEDKSRGEPGLRLV